jgi:DNA-binding NarL/FixJ family response regulator
MSYEATGFQNEVPWDAASCDQSPERALQPVVIGHARPLVLAGCELLLRRLPDLRLVREETFEALVDACARAGDCIAVFDPCHDARPLRELVGRLRERAPRARIVLVSDEQSPLAVREAIALGVLAYVDAAAPEAEIRAAFESALANRRYLAPEITSRLIESYSVERLTAREMDVLARLSIGACNKVIARELDLAVGTVKSHVRAIMAKLDSRTRTAAVAEACRVGLIRLA